MALNLADRYAVRQNIVPRCTIAAGNYALYLLGGTPTTSQLEWAREAVRNPGYFGEQLSWYAINHQSYIDTGSSISDVDLQSVVETAINTHFISS